MDPRMLSVWLPNWPIQRLLAANANANNQPLPCHRHAPPDRLPLVLVSRDPRRALRVVACCRLASAIGIRIAMSGSEADSLLQAATSGQATIQAHDRQADDEALQSLAHACAEQFSPIVALEPLGPRPWAGQQLHTPQGLLIDVSGIGPLFQGEQSLCHAVDRFFRNRNLQPRLALACTAAAAWGLSRTKASRTGFTENSEPQYLITSPHNEFHHLATLPVRMMRLEPKTVETLARLGVHELGELLRLPRAALATRFDDMLILRIDQLLGNVTETLPAYHHQTRIRTQTDLDYPTRDRDIIEYQIKLLSASLLQQLSQRDLGALQVVCRLELLKHDPVELSIGLFTPTIDAEHLFGLLSHCLQRQGLPEDVHRISLLAQLTGPLQTRQLDLIPGANQTNRAAPRALASLIDTLAGRLGRQSVLSVRRLKNPQPEDAYRLQPLTGQPIGAIRSPSRPVQRSPTGKRRRSRSDTLCQSRREQDPTLDSADHRITPSIDDPLRRPSTLFPEPIAIKVIEKRTGTPPERFQYHNIHVRTHRYWGPERIETAWWAGASVRRDYYRIETQQGDWLWIFRKLTTDEWFLHGLFD